ncbi:unnamed protein product [Rangifer tarandus platyrhynchus]|uniref:Uncharacterized protein n=1 Tax=Rangifer tarandus platyrhynchus TaxID=3082113 RepID=A0ABN8YFK0_RANTA|nr:unnamed protein product [Rangifer tarandus platyrhynchus]
MCIHHPLSSVNTFISAIFCLLKEKKKKGGKGIRKKKTFVSSIFFSPEELHIIYSLQYRQAMLCTSSDRHEFQSQWFSYIFSKKRNGLDFSFHGVLMSNCIKYKFCC